MNNSVNSMKVFLSCSLGAFIGTWVAPQVLQVNPGFGWLGPIAAFLIGYLDHNFRLDYKFFREVINFREVIAANPTAWGATCELMGDNRFLCGSYAAMGASVGYHFSNAFIGVLIGGVLGVIASVLLRIYHVAPARSK